MTSRSRAGVCPGPFRSPWEGLRDAGGRSLRAPRLGEESDGPGLVASEVGAAAVILVPEGLQDKWREGLDWKMEVLDANSSYS